MFTAAASNTAGGSSSTRVAPLRQQHTVTFPTIHAVSAGGWISSGVQ
jgi:hypothetical protein